MTIDIKQMIREARAAGKVAADRKLNELVKAGPRWNVVNDPLFSDPTEKKDIVGQMLDLCGFANIRLVEMNSNSKTWQNLKKYAAVDGNRIMVHSSEYGKTLSIFDMSRRQEVSVNKAACEGALEVLEEYGIRGYVDSRLD